jgi:hypothetical protein
MGNTSNTTFVAPLGHILYWIGCAVAVVSTVIFLFEAFALIDGRVTNLATFLDPFAPWQNGFLPTMPQTFALALGSWLLGLLCRRVLAGEVERDLYLTAEEVERNSREYWP